MLDDRLSVAMRKKLDLLVNIARLVQAQVQDQIVGEEGGEVTFPLL